jgi:O-antigen/teichoic acid export membrane protein
MRKADLSMADSRGVHLPVSSPESQPRDRASADGLLRGSVWMVSMRWGIRLIGLVSVAVLARLLTPADFGIVAMALVVSGLLDTVSYAGVDLALIRSRADTSDLRDSAWTIQVMQATLVAALLLMVAPVAASYYNEPRVATVIRWLALKSFIDGFQNIGVVAFQKDLDFAKEFRFNIFSRLLNLIAAIGAAVIFRNYLALVIGMLSGSFITVAMSYVMHPYRPRFSLAKVRQLSSFSTWLLLSRVGTFLAGGSDQFIAGGIVGATALGNYNVSTQLATMPSVELVMPLRRALFPNLSRQQDDPEAFRRMVLHAFGTLAILCFALSFGLVMTADDVVPILLGPQWHEATTLVKWLAVYGAFASLASMLEIPMWVLGKTRQTALQSWLQVIVLVPLVVISIHEYGILGAAVSRATVAIFMFPLLMYFAARVCPVSLRDLASTLWRPLLAGVLMMLSLSAPLAYPSNVWLMLLAKVALGGSVYVGTLLVSWMLSGKPDSIEAAMIRRWRTARDVAN